ncbi:MAG: hypothetical protein SO386_06195 [Eubacteriales bacterium]|nr:hypothetical protein [Eubacteriales bacterium]
MANVATKNYDAITVREKDVNAYRAFGWVRTNDKPDEVKEGKNAPNVVMKRKLPYGRNPDLANCERKYFKLYKKKFRQLPILGILSFLLMIAFFAVAVFELYFGIGGIIASSKKTDAPADKPAAEAVANAEDKTPSDGKTNDDNTNTTTKSNGIKDILNDVNDKYVAKYLNPMLKDTVVYIVDESVIVTDEETQKTYVPQGTKITVEEGSGENVTTKEVEVTSDAKVKTDANGKKYITLANTAKLFSVEALAETIGIEKYLTSEIFVGVVSLLLFVIFLVIFCEIAKIKKKRRENFAKLADLEYEANCIVTDMRNRDYSLMNRIERKQAMWTNIIANGIRQANASNVTYSDDDDDYE